jgi:hypothetical protein
MLDTFHPSAATAVNTEHELLEAMIKHRTCK